MDARAVTVALDDLSPRGWFARQPAPFKRALIAETRRVTFARGAWLYGAEDDAAGLYALLGGSVRVYATLPRGGTAFIDLLQPGAWFGQVALLRGGRRAVTTMAATAVDALVAPRRALQRLARERPEAWESFAALDVQQMQYVLRAHAETLIHTPRARVAGRLAALSPRPRLPSGPTVIPLTQSDLAELVGVERKTVNRILQSFAREGLISVGYGEIHVHEHARLTQMLNEPAT